MKSITLIETRNGCGICERQPRFDVMLFGKKVGQLYFNMTGYVGTLPVPSGCPSGYGNLTIGEQSISFFRKEITKLNKEWKLPR